LYATIILESDAININIAIFEFVGSMVSGDKVRWSDFPLSDVMRVQWIPGKRRETSGRNEDD